MVLMAHFFQWRDPAKTTLEGIEPAGAFTVDLRFNLFFAFALLNPSKVLAATPLNLSLMASIVPRVGTFPKYLL